MLIEFLAGLIVTRRIVSVLNPYEPGRWSDPKSKIFTWPLGWGIKPVVREPELLKEPICCLGSGVGGIGVSVGKYVAVGASGWKGVAVAVASTGLNRKFGFIPTATGELAGEIGKLQAEIKLSSTSRMRGSFLCIVEY